MTLILQFVFSAYLFANFQFKARTISNTLRIRETQVFEFALSPLWKPTLFLMGYRGEHEIKGLFHYKKWRCYSAKDMHQDRMDRWKNLRQNAPRYDFGQARKVWTELFTTNQNVFAFESERIHSEEKISGDLTMFDVAEVHHE